jgi:glutamate-ammonia-ligase adenylyltransferase
MGWAGMDAVAVADPLPRAEYSRFVQRVRRRYDVERLLLPAGTPDAVVIRNLIERLQADGRDLAAALRVARHLVIERLAVLDIEQAAPLEAITSTMSSLAEVALSLALVQAQAEADERYGAALDTQGRPMSLWIVGMGKLGARELNVSSDIDLVYVYEDDGHTQGPRPVSFHEYFSWVARRLYALIGETTDDGFVFRVDLALRPNGNSGPPVLSLAMLEEYFQVQGREWERFAWLKSRVIAPRDVVADSRALALRALVTPFVYRRYLDYGIFEGLRRLHRKIRDQAQRRAAGRPERANDVKLSRGGIREIEFIVQLLLVVRGGQFPEIRTRSTLRGLQRLAERGLMKADTAARLAAGYTFLRRVEHRIQYLDDQQTHLLPGADADLAWIAHSLGLVCERPQSCAMIDGLCEVRELVAAEFDALLREGQGSQPEEVRGICRSCGPGPQPVDSESLLDRMPQALAERLRVWVHQPRVLALRDESRLRLGRLMHHTARALRDGSCSTEGALRFIDWLDPLLRRESYLALLVERPEVHRRLLRLLGLARWPMRYLMQHPGVIDELADERLLHQRFDRAGFIAELEDRRCAWQRAGEDDEDKLLDTLRRAHHAEVFRTLVRDIEGELSVEAVADDLSALAEAVLDTAVRWCWARLKQRHREIPGLAVIAYGKLGGRELGYGGDVDLVFVYGDAEADADEAEEADRALPAEPDARSAQLAQEVYAGFLRKLIPWLTLRTSAGGLFDIDTALRPNGNSGLLVTSIDAFERYQQGRGSNTAWTWEHQALTRARCVCGPAALAARFEATRRCVLTAARDPLALREEVQTMREKVRLARPVPAGRFDVKHSPGGMMDVEFAVQYLVLAHARTHAALLENAGNIALLQRAEAAGLLAPGLGHAAADAYRELRRAQHRARLDEQPTQFDPDTLAGPSAAVLALWHAVFD